MREELCVRSFSAALYLPYPVRKSLSPYPKNNNDYGMRLVKDLFAR
jgi:hypothetical protein